MTARRPMITNIRVTTRPREQGVEMMDRTPGEQNVPCNGCKLCCSDGELVMLDPTMGDDPTKYQTIKQTILLSGRPTELTALKQKPNGDCLYLGEAGCTIYEDRPIVCRSFTCIQFFDWLGAMPAAKRREAVAQAGDGKKAVLAKGREMKAILAGQAR